MNKSVLTERIQASRKRLEDDIARIGDERISLVILHGEWSIKDLIGHLGFWENRVVTLLSILRAGKMPGPNQDVDELNAQAILEFRLQSYLDVRRQEEYAYQKVLELVRDASDDELFTAHHFGKTEGRAFSEIIADNTWEHYEEHQAEISAWLKRIA